MKAPPDSAPTPAKNRILLVDDHAVVRDGAALWINQTEDLEVCGTAGQSRDAISTIEHLKPDMVITDIGMPGRDGLELTKDIKARWPVLPVLIFSVHDETLYAGRALRAGARGYCNKNAGTEGLIEAIRTILRGRMAFSSETTTQLLEESSGRPSPANPLGGLSDREFEVLRCFGVGQTNQEAAANLGLSAKTVETHSLNIRKKLGLRSPAELIRHAVHLCSIENAQNVRPS
jgi:DNA-binding NarL/FixJ family response regulator